MTMLTQNGIYESKTRKTIKKIWGATKFAALVGTITTVPMGLTYLSAKYEQEKKESIQPNTVEKTKDLDGNGIDDLILKLNNGNKIPLFGIENGNQVKYFTPEQMLEENPNSIIDYKRIESKLNN